MSDAYMHAIATDSTNELRAILDSKDDNDIANVLSGPDVYRAAQHGALGAAKLLLDKGANIDAISTDGSGALHAAVKQGNADFVNLLIQHHCNVNLRNVHRFTAVMIAIENGWTQILSLLLRNGADVDAANSLGDTAVHFAVKHEKVEMLKMLIQHKCNVNAQNLLGITAVMISVEKRNKNMLALLISAGADLNAKNDLGSNTLMISVVTTNLSALHILLEQLDKNKKSFNINAVDKHGQTALMLAASKKRSDMVKLLCDRGSNVNFQNSISGQTALHYAVLSDDVPTVETLLEAGACVNVINKTLKTPLNFSLSNKIKRILMKAGAFVTGEIFNLTPSTEESISKHSERSTLLQNTQYYTDIQMIDNNAYAHITGAFELNDGMKTPHLQHPHQSICIVTPVPSLIKRSRMVWFNQS